MKRPLGVALAVLIASGVSTPASASFHAMQIEQVIGGVNEDPSAQAIQLRMRSGGQNLVQQAKLVARDAMGLNPVEVIDFTTSVSGNAAGDRILVTSSSFSTMISCTPDFAMTNLIPASYLAAGTLTFENDAGTLIVWRLTWGGGAYTGPTDASSVNDDDGDVAPPYGGDLPSSSAQALLFQGSASARGTTNAADYALTAGPSTWTNNAGASCTLQAPPVIFDGLVNRPLGGATLSAGPPRLGLARGHDHLIVSNIGSSGKDGVSIDLGESEFGLVELQIADPTLPPGTGYRIEGVGLVGPGPEVVSVFVCHIDAAGNDFYTWQSVHYSSPVLAAVFLDGVIVASERLRGPGDGVAVSGPDQPTGVDVWWEMAGFGMGLLDFALPVQVTLPTAGSFQGDEIHFIAETAGPPVIALNEMTVRGFAPGGTPPFSLDVFRERVGLFGIVHEAQGQARLEPGGDHLTISNIGSSGKDGVRFTDPDSPTSTGECDGCPSRFDLHWEPLDPTGALPAGAELSIQAFGSVGGVPDQLIGQGTTAKDATGRWVLGADFSPIGNTTMTVQVLNGGSVVAEQQGHRGPDVALADIAPHDWHWDNESGPGVQRINHPGGCTVTFDLPTNIVILPSGPARGIPTSGDAVRIIPEDHTADTDYFQELLLSTAGIPGMTIDGEGSVPAIATPEIDPGIAPGTVHLAPVAPNPFRSDVSVYFTLSASREVTLRVYDVAGRVVRNLLEGELLRAGPQTLAWDGRDALGGEAGAGVYVFEVRTHEGARTVKGTLIR